jgi:hypothetical protein
MTMNANDQILFREYPIWFWLTGVMVLGVSCAAVDGVLVRFSFALVGIAVFGFAPVLTVAVDHTRGTLNLNYRSIFRASPRALPLSEICSVNVAEDDEGERMYRIELRLWSGEVVPLRVCYTVGKRRKERRAQLIRSASGS